MDNRRRNTVAFWLLGLCNNFAYVVMLSAAKDILEKDSHHPVKECRTTITTRDCQLISTGSVLLADIIPALIIKLSAPLFIHRIPFGIRHLIVVLLQASSFFIVASSTNTIIALIGVILASFGSGFGEISYLALTSNYPSSVVSSWSSGTGGAGIIGALTYALLTDPQLLGLTPKHAMFLMLILPLLFSITYWNILIKPRNIHRVDIRDIRSWLISTDNDSDNSDEEALIRDDNEEEVEEFRTIILLKYMIPLIVVYCAEYYINQGLLELIEFPCSLGFQMSADSQYRWFQVLYQFGVFISRSSSDFIAIPSRMLPVLSVLQILNAIILVTVAITNYIPHITIAFAIIIFEGLLGGASYVNTFKAVHKEVPYAKREYCMGVVSISDTIGIVGAGFLAMPVHNYICHLPLQ